MSDYDKRVDELAAGMAHKVLPEAVRLENALNIWVHDMREQELAKVKAGGRLSVPALAYEEVLKLRTGLQHIFSDRRRRILGRWERRKARRAAALAELMKDYFNS